MSKPEIIARIKGLFSVLLVLTLGAVIIIPLTSTFLGEEQRSVSHHMSIYMVLILAWIFLAAVFGITYMISEGSKGLKPISLPVNKEEA